MASIKIILDIRRVKSDSTYPLKLRIYQGKKYRDIPLQASVKADDWDDKKRVVKSSHPNYRLLNHKILKQYLELEATLLKMDTSQLIDLDDLVVKAKGKEKPLPTFIMLPPKISTSN